MLILFFVCFTETVDRVYSRLVSMTHDLFGLPFRIVFEAALRNKASVGSGHLLFLLLRISMITKKYKLSFDP